MKQRRVSNRLVRGCNVSIGRWTIGNKRIGAIAYKGIGRTWLLWQGFCVRRRWARRRWLLVVCSVGWHFTGVSVRWEHTLRRFWSSWGSWIFIRVWIGPFLLFSRRKNGVERNSAEMNKTRNQEDRFPLFYSLQVKKKKKRAYSNYFLLIGRIHCYSYYFQSKYPLLTFSFSNISNILYPPYVL